MLKRTTEYDFTTVQYLFETLGVMAYWLVTSGSGERGVLEKVVMDFFMEALKNKSDLMNFCLQVLAIYLQLENSTNQQYVKIYESLLMPENWQEENQSLMSAYIQFLIAFIAKHRHKLIEDKGAVEVILSKIIEIEHVELFYRFMEAIMINTSLREFYESGYLNLVVQGGQVVSKTVPGRKASLIFICKLVLYYDTIECLNLVPLVLPRSTSAASSISTNSWRPISTSSRPSPSATTGNTSLPPSAGLPISSTFLVTQLLPELAVVGHHRQQPHHEHLGKVQHPEHVPQRERGRAEGKEGVDL